MKTSIDAYVLWEKAPAEGAIEICYGKFVSLEIIKGKGTIENQRFSFSSKGEVCLKINVSEAKVEYGAYATMVRVKTNDNPFTFFLRDALHKKCPVYVPEYGVAVFPGPKIPDWIELLRQISNKKLTSDFDRILAAPEETFTNASRRTVKQYCPVWLGIPGDMRIFRTGYKMGRGKVKGAKNNCQEIIEPTFHNILHPKSESDNNPYDSYELSFFLGQGSSCQFNVKRHLDQDCLPILHTERREEDIVYHQTAFAIMESGPPSKGKISGTDFWNRAAHGGNHSLTKKEMTTLKKKVKNEVHNNETVYCCRVTATNKGKVPRYAWFKAPIAQSPDFPRKDFGRKLINNFGGKQGFSLLNGKNVISVNLINGKPMPQPEMAVLLQPKTSVSFDIYIPHSAVPIVRAEKLLKLKFEKLLVAVRKFWLTRLNQGTKIEIPEEKINSIVKAGLLHLDLACFGKNGVIAPTIGDYLPIGTESAPIIMYFDSMGWHELAEQCIEYFLKVQRPDGFIQNYYESETGPVLWTMGEHFRYTGNLKWLKRVKPNILKACDYLLKWRENNKKDEFRKKGFYGLIDGQVADPVEKYHSFFLNALNYIGLKRAAEMLEKVDKKKAEKLKTEMTEYLKDLRTAFYDTMSRAPLFPLGDGTWAPNIPGNAENNGMASLYADGGNWYTHGTFQRNATTGPLWLIISEVLEPQEIGTDLLLKTNQYPKTLDNAGLSQPYYYRHDYAHIMRGEVKHFLKAYYNQLTGLIDRETYTFLEHYYGLSYHKTHEEGWFLMQTRWMLCLEKGNELHLLSGIPRAWLKNGKTINVSGMKSYFGTISILVKSNINNGKIDAEIDLKATKKPKRIILRLPHPSGLKPTKISGGKYLPENESVEIKPKGNKATVILNY